MTQLLEGLHIAEVKDPEDVECPFHEDEHACDKRAVSNVYLEGNATTLGENLAEGKRANSTVTRTTKDCPDEAHSRPRKVADPDQRAEVDREITIKKKDENCRYPVGFSAHHLIPAKESLARATDLHKYIDKEKGKICCHLGYNVDGNENGVWLPGLHAVNSKDGVDVWGAASEALPDKEGVGRTVRMRKELDSERTDGKRVKYAYALLEGPKATATSAFALTNMKWMYVRAAMTSLKPHRQFHDRHVDYSSKVELHLDDVAAALDALTGNKRGLTPICGECKKRKNKKPAPLPPPPIGLLGCLNNGSQFLRGKLLGHIRDDEYYTSSWCGPLSPRK